MNAQINDGNVHLVKFYIPHQGIARFVRGALTC